MKDKACSTYIFLVLSLLFWVFTLLRIPIEFYDLGGDSAQYIILAENLSKAGNLRMVNYPKEPFSNQPPVLSLMLTPILYFFGRNFWMMHLIICFLGYASLIFFYKIFAQYDNKIALLTTVFLAINHLFWVYCVRILTDIPFLFLSGFSLFFLSKYKNKQSFFNREGVLSAIGLSAAYLCRYIGIVLFLISLFYLYSETENRQRKAQFKKMLFLISIYIPIFLYWNFRNLNVYNPYIHSPVNYKPYLKLISVSPQALFFRFINEINFYFSRIAEMNFTFFTDKFTSVIFLDALSILMVFVVLMGLWDTVKQKKYIFAYYFVIYLALISFWPYYEDGRYVLPILPFVLFYFILGLKKIKNFLPKRANRIYPLLLLPVFILQILSLPMKKISLQDIAVPYKNFILLHKWIAANLPSGEIIISRKPTVTYFYTGHKSMRYSFTPKTEEIWQEIIKINAKYLVVDEFTRETYLYLSPFLYEYKNKLMLLYRIGDTGIFEIRK